MPGKVEDEDLLAMVNNSTAHEKSSGLGHGQGGRLVVPDLPRKGKLEPVNDWSTISLGSGVNNGPSDISPLLNMHEVLIN